MPALKSGSRIQPVQLFVRGSSNIASTMFYANSAMKDKPNMGLSLLAPQENDA
jgi:hypothetical protein